jgi:hypothetical protein
MSDVLKLAEEMNSPQPCRIPLRRALYLHIQIKIEPSLIGKKKDANRHPFLVVRAWVLLYSAQFPKLIWSCHPDSLKSLYAIRSNMPGL